MNIGLITYKNLGVLLTSLLLFFEEKVPVFISHKHDDLDDVKGIIEFLEKDFNVIAYIDSRDLSMPKITSGEIAEKIKDRIKNAKGLFY